MPKTMMRISKAFVICSTRVLLKRSADLPGVTGKQQEWQNEDCARQRQVARAEQLIGGQFDGAHRDDHLIDVVVEGRQELSPEDGLESAIHDESGIPAGLGSGAIRGGHAVYYCILRALLADQPVDLYSIIYGFRLA